MIKIDSEWKSDGHGHLFRESLGRVARPEFLQASWLAYSLPCLAARRRRSFVLHPLCPDVSAHFLSPAFEGASYAITSRDLWRVAQP